MKRLINTYRSFNWIEKALPVVVALVVTLLSMLTSCAPSVPMTDTEVERAFYKQNGYWPESMYECTTVRDSLTLTQKP